ncbi:MAG: metal dependent phosphohydrolase, partial [Deltaproteobacteria bacterium]|nr:metal dependent phosphohydrolase [Deltaproteobacteria bacterium]
MWIALVAGLVVAGLTAILAARASREESLRKTREAIDIARGESAAAVKAAELEAAARKKSLETAARTEALEIRTAGDEALARAEAAAERRAEALARIQAEVAGSQDALDQREEHLAADQREVQSRRDRATGVERDAHGRLESCRLELEARAGVRAIELIQNLGQTWLDDARARAAAQLRTIDQTPA